MNYRHIYHAGNFADIFKHSILIALFEQLRKKDTAFFFLDTHAGLGIYDLSKEEALKTQEFSGGWRRIERASHLPERVRQLAVCVEQLETHLQAPNLYPGSPWITQCFLRETDRAALCELHPEDCQTLKKNFYRSRNIAVHNRDGYEALNALLPPKEKRGLVLIDPPYESERDDFKHLINDLLLAHKKWSNGIIALWFPIKTRQPINEFYRALKASGLPKLLCAELCIFPDDSEFHLNGAGMVIVNTPWQLDVELKEILPALCQLLTPTPVMGDKALGKWQLDWLNPPT